ncbi:MAG TPA: triose-phosphate isomerase [Candidatus Paceibacterota bacterium]|nr:triose-phosphate isomerase [Candidatus Paceibacterota bacterium]
MSKMSKKIVIANWKMNPVSFKEAEKLFKNINKTFFGLKKTEVVICSPCVYLAKLKNLAKKIKLGGENIFYEESGAYTGEISAEMLYDTGAKYVILGHSERRTIFGETNEDVNKKIKAGLSVGLTPIVCIGEKERSENNEYLNFVKEQIELGFKNILKTSIGKIIVAYEPVWAIGKNAVREATAEEFLEISIFIKKVLSDKFGAQEASKVKIIYGGSVNPKNIEAFIKVGQADGFLVGRASLDPIKFGEIINLTENISEK